ncbi:MAG: sugar ABC transporter permease [Chloroflexi bacterium]|nr:sugar ABC transporter permease [Chloroflexota bacterium]
MTTMPMSQTEQPITREQELLVGKRRRQLQEALTGYLFVLPAAIATFVFGLWPVISGFYESIKSGWPLTNSYVGLNNYVRSLGNITFILLFALSLIFIYLGYRSWRAAYIHQQETGGNLWLYILPGQLIGAGLAVLIFQFVTGTTEYDWVPVVLLVIGVGGFYTVDRWQTSPETKPQSVNDIGLSSLVFVAMLVLWIVMAVGYSGELDPALLRFGLLVSVAGIAVFTVQFLLRTNNARLAQLTQTVERWIPVAHSPLDNRSQKLVDTILGWLVFGGIAVLWVAASEVASGLITTRFLVWSAELAIPVGLLFYVTNRISGNRARRQAATTGLERVSAEWANDLPEVQRLSLMMLVYSVVVVVLVVAVGLIFVVLGLPGLGIIIAVGGLVGLRMAGERYWAAFEQIANRISPRPFPEDAFNAARQMRQYRNRQIRRTTDYGVLGVVVLAMVAGIGISLLGLVGGPEWVFLLLLLALFYLAGQRARRMKNTRFIGASISMGTLMLLAILLARYTVAQMEDDIEPARDIAVLIFNEPVLDATVPATDSELETDTGVQGLSPDGDVLVTVDVDGETIEAPLAAAYWQELPVKRIKGIMAEFTNGTKVLVELPDGTVTEGQINGKTQLTFTANRPEAVRQVDIYSGLDVGEGVLRAEGYTEPLMRQVYAALVFFLGIGTIYVMTMVRRQVDEDYEPDVVRSMFRGISGALSGLLAAVLACLLPAVGLAADRSLDTFPVATVLLTAVTLVAIYALWRWFSRLDSARQEVQLARLQTIDKGLQYLYLGLLVVLPLFVVGILLDSELGLFPTMTAVFVVLGLVSLRWTVPWLVDQHPSVRRWLYWSRVLMTIAVLLAFFYLIGAARLSQQASSGMAALSEEQFERAYEFASGEDRPVNLYAGRISAQLRYWPQFFLVAVGAMLIGMAYLVWQSAQKRETPLGFGMTILLAVMMMVGGWLTLSELPSALSLAGREAEETSKALTRTAMYSLGTVPVQLVLGLFLAYLLFSEISWGKSLYRVIYFMPYIAPSVATSAVFLVIFSLDEKSLANRVLSWLGIGKLEWLKEPDGVVRVFFEHVIGGNPDTIPNMLQGPSLALTTVILYNIWVFAGYNAVVFLAGLGAIPSELYEAAEVDGAGRWSRFRNITLPLLSPTTFFLSMLSIIGTFKAFSHIYVLRRQAVGKEIDTMSVYIFNSLYSANDPGYAASLAFTLFGVILILTLVQNRVAREQVFYG